MQPQMQPEQGLFLLQVFLPGIKNETQITRKVIRAIPADKLEYRPDPASRAAFELATHIGVAENFFLDAVASGQFTPLTKPEAVKSPADLASWYSDTFERNIERVERLSGEQLVKIVDFRGLFQLPAVSYLQFATSHTIHHRGQLSAYLRAMGGKVPSIYGESYDDAQARKAAQVASD